MVVKAGAAPRGCACSQPLGGDAVAAVEGERTLEEAGDAGGALVAVDLGVGEPGVDVDDRADDLPSSDATAARPERE